MEEREFVKELTKKAAELKADIRELCASGYPTCMKSALSCAEIVTWIYHRLPYLEWQEKFGGLKLPLTARMRLILSKGYASAAAYLAEAQVGLCSKEEVFETYGKLNSPFGPYGGPWNRNGGYVVIGSAGHGLPITVGMARAFKMDRGLMTACCLMGEGDLMEGSVWEAFMLAPKLKLGNLICIVDRDGLSAGRSADDVVSIGSVAEKGRAFGWNVYELDGHSLTDLCNLIPNLPNPVNCIEVPTLVIADTAEKV